MLQQTRVETVIPYFERFMERFPTIQDLAAADLDELLSLWSGLGYYRRARLMHKAAGEIASRGAFPKTLPGLRALPGIGEYTAAAVASIAFGVVEPVMDGNVERVTARYLALLEDPKSKPVRQKLSAVAADLLDPKRPGDSNQALMELGATVCLPRRPQCLLCPLREGCRAAAEGDPERYPPPRKRRAVQRVRRLLAWAESDAGVLLFRRPDESELLAGTWELPWVDLPTRGDEPTNGELKIAATQLAESYGGSWRFGTSLGSVQHGITHRAIDARIVSAEIEAGERVAEGREAARYPATTIADLATSSLIDKAVAAVVKAAAS